MPSTPLLEAASSSKILYELSSLILKLLISKRENGLITYSSWGVVDKTNEHKFLFTEDFKPKPAILKIRETLDAESVDLVYLD